MEKRIKKPVDLYVFSVTKHPDKVKVKGDSVRPIANPSVSVKKGYSTYYDFSPSVESKGSGIDFLVNFLGYPDKESAIKALAEFECPEKVEIKEEPRVFSPPEPCKEYDACFDYLCGKRGIYPDIIKMLIDRKLLYQTKERGYTNIVFINRPGEYGEIHGITEEDFKSKIKGSKEGGYWWFSPVEDNCLKTVEKAYICEASIDAISLYQLIRERAIYISVGGAKSYKAIEQIKMFCQSRGYEIILAVDNDAVVGKKAGDECRNKFKDIKSIPLEEYKGFKDWNEVLLHSPECYVE